MKDKQVEIFFLSYHPSRVKKHQKGMINKPYCIPLSNLCKMMCVFGQCWSGFLASIMIDNAKMFMSIKDTIGTPNGHQGYKTHQRDMTLLK